MRFNNSDIQESVQVIYRNQTYLLMNYRRAGETIRVATRTKHSHFTQLLTKYIF